MSDKKHDFSDTVIEQIAERAADKAMEKLTNHVYKEVGKGVLNRLFWIAGAGCVGLYLTMRSKGIIN